MLQYLIHTTIIWLACLLFYELLLRRERLHQYNRIFLLCSLAIGLCLPFVNMNRLANATQHHFSRPAAQIDAIKNVIRLPYQQDPGRERPAAITRQHHTETLWLIIYLSGVFLALSFILLEGFQLLCLYRNGKKRKEHNYTIVETGKPHATFSFFRIIFTGNRDEYDPGHWDLLMRHEQVHGRLLHSIDNLLLIALRILFWFHPLPYIYYKRLRMIHEFQADSAVATDIPYYGNFLLEQNMLRSTSLLVHSFNYSPIKTRIIMLTSIRSTKRKSWKYLAVSPMILAFLLLCTQTSFSGARTKVQNKIYFKGNEIMLAPLKVIPSGYEATVYQQKKMFLYATLSDSVAVKNQRTGIYEMAPVKTDTMPVAINGQPILGNEPQYLQPEYNNKYSLPVFTGSGNDLEVYLFTTLKKELNQLEDGRYILRLNRLVIDNQGNIAYYEPEGIDWFMGSEETLPVIPDNIRQAINQKLTSACNAPLKFKPALQDGKPVNVRLSLDKYAIEVKDHKAALVERGGC